ncbi:MAG: hypothetical protein ACT4PV_05080 [Planctomycetaceae bacterium]
MRGLSLLLAMALAARAGDEINAAWLASDLAVAKRVAALLPPGERTTAAFRDALEPFDVREDRDIGFGARRAHLALYGGYTTTWITFVSHGDTIGPVRVDVTGGPPEVRTRIAAAWGKLAPKEVPQGFVYECGEPAGPVAFSEARAKALGGPLKMEPHPDLVKDYALLWSPVSLLLYGTMCGDGGDPPPGREALERILAHPRKLPVLLDLLRGPNPEGRVYALEGLERLRKGGVEIDAAREATIKAVRELAVRIQCCAGCILYDEQAEKALADRMEELPG